MILRRNKSEQANDNKEILDEQIEVIPTASKLKKDEHEDAKERVKKFTSYRATLKKSLPYILLGLLLLYLEYNLIGITYTIASVSIYGVIIFVYTKSVRTKYGKLLLDVNIEHGTTEITRYFIPEELWAIITFSHPLIPGIIKMNGQDVYISKKTYKLENSNTIYAIDFAWLHFNQLEYTRNKEVLDRAVSFATNLTKENAELEKLMYMYSIIEGKRQTDEWITSSTIAYRNPALEVSNEISALKHKIDQLISENKNLIFSDEELRELQGEAVDKMQAVKKKKEAAEVLNER